ncbi:MAG: hypothetical protein U0235_26495 [Polyangiaceae bacterium]
MKRRPPPPLPEPAPTEPLIEAEEPTGQVKAVVGKGSLPPPMPPPRRPVARTPSTPPGSDGDHANDPDTLVRAAPRVSIPAEEEVGAPAAAFTTTGETRVPAPSTVEANPVSEPVRPSDRMPPTVRIARRSTDGTYGRLLTIAGAAGALVGALAFAFWPRTPPPPRTSATLDAGAVTTLAPTPSLASAAAAASAEVAIGIDAGGVLDAEAVAVVDAGEVDGTVTGALSSDASTEEDDAAAALEARLAEARRRRRERAAAEAASAKPEAGASEPDNPYGDPTVATTASSAPSAAPAASAAPSSATSAAPKPTATESAEPPPSKPRADVDAGE